MTTKSPLSLVLFILLAGLALLLAACASAEPTPTAVPPTKTPAPTLTHQAMPVNTAAPTATVTVPPSPTAVPTDQPSPTPTYTPTPLPRDVRAALQLVADGFVSPVELVDPGDGRLFVTDQVGVVYVLDAAENRLPQPLIDVRGKMVDLDEAYDERGLLGMVLHPNFADNGRFYLHYSAPLRPNAPGDWNHTGIVAEYTISPDDPNRADLASERLIIQIDQPQTNHNGGQLAFGPDGYLYVGIGDGGNANDIGLGHAPEGNGQTRDNLLGTILRLDVDSAAPYSIPADNPFVGQAGLPEIYAYGFRNPFRFSFDVDGSLYVGDVGQDYIEEIDRVVSGGNYGWPVREGTTCFNKTMVTQPLETCATQSAYGDTFLDPVLEYRRDFGRSVIGGFVYRGSALPALYGRYLFVDWVSNNEVGNNQIYYADVQPPDAGLWELVAVPLTQPDGSALPAFYTLSFGQDANRELYVLTADFYNPVGSSGKVYKLMPAP